MSNNVFQKERQSLILEISNKIKGNVLWNYCSIIELYECSQWIRANAMKLNVPSQMLNLVKYYFAEKKAFRSYGNGLN